MNSPRLRRRLHRIAQMAMAAWAAFRYRRRIGAPVWRDGFRFLRALFRRRLPTPFGLWRARLRACRSCDLFDPAAGTCGDNRTVLLIDLPGGGQRVAQNGCSCLVGIKASEQDSECFLVSIGGPSGWPSRPSRKTPPDPTQKAP